MVAAFLIVFTLAGAAALLGFRSARRSGERLARIVEECEATAEAARYCGATGLANRQRILEWLTANLEVEGARGAVVRVAFEPFSEDFQRESGLARNVAETLRSVARGRPLIGRLGPGEYLLALDGSAGSAELIATARAACNALSGLVADAQRLRVGVAMAVSGDTAASLLERAEQGLHLRSQVDHAELAVTDQALHVQIESRSSAADKLAMAIGAGRIEPFFQPFVELGSGRVLGFEVLARWRDEQGRLHRPSEFLPLAEKTGLVGPMYRALLRAAAAEARTWPSEWTFSLNLSGRQLRDDTLVETTLHILRDTGVPPERFEIEISEPALEHDFDRALEVLSEFRTVGIGVVLDNFGSGGLPLKALARFPFDRIKVDDAAVREKGADPGATLSLISATARHLGVPLLVQGIETDAGARAAKVHGSAIGQGFLFGRPDRRTECFRLEGMLGAAWRGDNHAA